MFLAAFLAVFCAPARVKTTGFTPWVKPGSRGLTGRCRPLYSARFATPACRAMFPPSRRHECPCGGIGRRARLKIEFRKECWFDSGQGHQGILFLLLSIRIVPELRYFFTVIRPVRFFQTSPLKLFLTFFISVSVRCSVRPDADASGVWRAACNHLASRRMWL